MHTITIMTWNPVTTDLDQIFFVVERPNDSHSYHKRRVMVTCGVKTL